MALIPFLTTSINILIKGDYRSDDTNHSKYCNKFIDKQAFSIFLVYSLLQYIPVIVVLLLHSDLAPDVL